MQLIFEKKWATHYEVKDSSGLTVCHLHCSPHSNKWYSSGHTANITFYEEIHRQIADKLEELNNKNDK